MNIDRASLLVSAFIMSAVGCTTISPTNPYDPETPSSQQEMSIFTGTIVPEVNIDMGEVAVNESGVGVVGTPDVDGRFSILLSAGVHALTILAPNHDDYVIGGVNLGIGEEREAGEIKLTAHRGGIIGSVTLDGGNNHFGTIVNISEISKSSITLGDGSFQFADIPVGVYNLVVVHQGYGSMTREVEVVRGEDTNVSLTLSQISGDFVVSQAPYTSSQTVTLELYGNIHDWIQVSEDASFTDSPPFEAFDSGLGVHAYTLSSADGVKTIYVRFSDDQVETTSTLEADVVFDTTQPEFAAFVVNDGGSFVSSESGMVTLAIQAFDNLSGIDGMRVAVDGDISDEQWISYAPLRSVTLDNPTIEGEKTIVMEFRDRAGNIRLVGPRRLILDTTAPNVAGATLMLRGLDRDGPSTLLTNTTLIAIDLAGATDTFGISDMMVAKDLSFTGSQWRSYVETLEWVLTPGDSEKSLYVKLRDEAGNVSQPISSSILLDQTPPRNGYVTINDGEQYALASSVEFTFKVEGEAVQFTLDGASWQDCALPICEAYLPGETQATTFAGGDGNKTLQILFRDAAGNVSPPRSDEIFVDSAAPMATQILTFAPHTTSAFLDLQESTDTMPGSGIAHYQVTASRTSGELVFDQIFPTSEAWVTDLPDMGVYDFKARVVDRAGNGSTWSSVQQSLVGLSASFVPDVEDVGGMLDRVYAYRGHIIFPHIKAGDTSVIELVSCDTRSQRCLDAGLVSSEIDMGVDLEDVVVVAYGDTIWTFAVHLNDSAPNDVQLYGLYHSLTDGDLPPIADWSNAGVLSTFVLPNDASAFLQPSLTAAANGAVLAVAFSAKETNDTYADRLVGAFLCPLAETCEDPSDWNNHTVIAYGETLYQPYRMSNTLSMDIGPDRLWISYGLADKAGGSCVSSAGRCGTGIASCRIYGDKNCFDGSTWDRVRLEFSRSGQAHDSKVMEVNGNLYVAALSDSLDGLIQWKCSVDGMDGCTDSADFQGPALLLDIQDIQPISSIGGRPAFTWWGGQLHFAAFDYLSGTLSYGRCSEGSTDCQDPGNWQIAEIYTQANISGQVDLALVHGNPHIFMGHGSGNTVLLEPRTPAPLQRAIVPMTMDDGLQGSWVARSDRAVDGYRMRYNQEGVEAIFDVAANEYVVTGDPSQNTFLVPADTGVTHYGQISAFKGQDSSIAAPYFEVKTGGVAKFDSQTTGAVPYAYAETDSCIAIAYTYSTAGKVQTCHKGLDCADTSQWNYYEWYADTVSNVSNRLSLAFNDTTLFFASNYEYDLYVRGRTVNSDCTLVDDEKMVMVRSGAASGMQPSYTNLLATNDQVFVTYTPNSNGTGADKMLHLASCDLSNACLDSFSDWSETNWPYLQTGSDMEIVDGTSESFLYMLSALNGPDVVLYRCNMNEHDCTTDTDFTSIGKILDIPDGIVDRRFVSVILESQNGQLLASYSDHFAWCDEGSDCVSAGQFQRGWYSAEFFSDLSPTITMLGATVDGDLILAGLRNNAQMIARCKGRCYNPDNWIGGYSALSNNLSWTQYRTQVGAPGSIADTGEITIIYRESVQSLQDYVRMATGLYMDYF